MKRSVPWIVLGSTTVVAVLAAVAVNTGVGWMIAAPVEAVPIGEMPLAAVEAPELSEEDRERALRAARVPSRDGYLEAILRRSLFDSTKVGVTGVGGAFGGVGGTGVDEDELARTDLKVKLIGTVVATNPSFSAALIVEDRSGATALGYGVGDNLLGAIVLKIEDKKVQIRRPDGRAEWITMDDEPVPRKPEPAGSATPAPTGATSESGIEQLSETEFVVPRALLDEQLQDLEGLSRMGRALLHRGPDGNFDGYRLSAIRRGSLPDQLGIRNGDVIHAVNGMKLDSVQGAMNAYQTLQNETGFSFEVTRRGQTMNLGYDVQ